ncbi:MAG: RNB domain-containing ribonuclease, partial [Clostridiaceae bacterium]|nr:RNB domain-containing ribonuclease [Clostridiaceae bacterium]
RVRAGLLEFEFPEMQITVDSAGRPIDIEAVEVTWAHELIEDFMIAANCYVAKRFHDLGAPLIYRVHEQPDIERLKSFIAVLRRLISIQMPKPAALMDVAGLAEILDRFKELPEGDILSGLLLRSLAKARYDTRCLGHFGLNEPYYSHYTAPIRRYADLIVHRVVRAYIAGRVPIKSKWVANLPQIAEHISETERNSMDAERASNDLRVAEYMSERIGERYPAIISGMHRAGFFCRLPNAVEGMVPYRLLGDYYDYDELTMTARGQSSGFELRLGMRVTVQVVEADPIRRSVTFYWFDQDEMVERARSTRSKAKRSSGKKADKNTAEPKSTARKTKGSTKPTKTKKKRK